VRYTSDDLLLRNAHESKISHYRAWVFVVIPLAAVLFQFYVPQFFSRIRFLELPLLVTLYFALMKRSAVQGTLIGAAIGLAQDSLSNQPLGLFGIVKTLVGYFAGSVGLGFDVDHPAIRVFLAMFFYLLHQLCKWVLSRALLNQAVDFDFSNTIFLAMLNALVGLFVFRFLDRLRERG